MNKKEFNFVIDRVEGDFIICETSEIIDVDKEPELKELFEIISVDENMVGLKADYIDAVEGSLIKITIDKELKTISINIDLDYKQTRENEMKNKYGHLWN